MHFSLKKYLSIWLVCKYFAYLILNQFKSGIVNFELT